MKKKVDERVRTLIQNGVRTHQRSFFVIVGDKGRELVVHLHHMLSKAVVKARPSVLWCYKKELGFSSHKMKRMKQIKKMVQRGMLETAEDNLFDTFISSTSIRWTFYRDTHKVLGNTYGMCVLQDFEALTPNLLCRTIETVEGGGVVVLLLRTMKSLRQLYSMTMDCHSRFRTASHGEVVPRFNERFILSLGTCMNCLIIDDEFNVLPVHTASRKLEPVTTAIKEGDSEELRELKDSLRDTQPAGALVGCTRTVDQAKAVLTVIEAISEKTLRSTVTLTAGRGRGKSAALGIAMAAAIGYGYSNIFVTAPSPENLKTMFQFVVKGFTALNYQEHIDYECLQSTNPDFNQAIVRVNVFHTHRQTIQYIHPTDHAALAQAELLVIDEAAAIPLPLVKNLLGPYLVFMASTINGYEGTGRSLSLKLIRQLRLGVASGAAGGAGNSEAAAASAQSTGGRVLRETTLEEPIRYSAGDPVEKWLNDLLCLEAQKALKPIAGGLPPPQQCELFYVNRDTLFSYHKAAEKFLQRLMGLYVSSHYKNTPNDLQLLSDAPSHHVFVLLGPVDETTNELPDMLCVAQVSLEGGIHRKAVDLSFSQGHAPAGDLIPWTVAQQFQDHEFPSLNGARVVRIATHPDVQKMGYGSRTLDLLSAYFQGNIRGLQQTPVSDDNFENPKDSGNADTLLAPRRKLPPLLQRLDERPPERLHWLGTSFGLTEELFKFWHKAQYRPVYLRQTANDLTGEFTTVMLRTLAADGLESQSQQWLADFNQDFRRRLLSLLGYGFRSFSPSLALSIVDPDVEEIAKSAGYSKALCDEFYSPYDLRRLESYSKNLVDHHAITDLIPQITRDIFLGRLPIRLSYVQCAIFTSLGLQFKTIDDVQKELNLPSNQVLALFNKACRKVSQWLRGLEEKEAEKELASTEKYEASAKAMHSVRESLGSEMASAGKKATKELAKKQADLLKDLSLPEYEIHGTEEDWNNALSGGTVPSTISVQGQGKKRAREVDAEETPKSKSKKSAEKGKQSPGSGVKSSHKKKRK